MPARPLLAVAVTAALLATPAVSAAAVPDADFGDGGTLVLDSSCAPADGGGLSLTPAAAGRSYLLDTCGDAPVALLARDDRGAPLAGFGVDGRVRLPRLQGCGATNAIVAPAPDGAVYVVAETVTLAPRGGEDSHLCVVRVRPSGALTPGFGGTGPVRRIERVGQGRNELISARADARGRLLLVATRDQGTNPSTSTALVSRLSRTGSADATFGARGLVALHRRGSLTVVWGGVRGVQPVVAMSAVTDPDAAEGLVVARLTESGRLDPAYSGDGYGVLRAADIGHGLVERRNVVMDAQGRVAALTSIPLGAAGGPRVDLVRLTPAGRPDTAFAARTTPYAGSRSRPPRAFTLQRVAGRMVAEIGVGSTVQMVGFDADGRRWTTGNGTHADEATATAYDPSRPLRYLVVQQSSAADASRSAVRVERTVLGG